jgi:hypothetical protein
MLVVRGRSPYSNVKQTKKEARVCPYPVQLNGSNERDAGDVMFCYELNQTLLCFLCSRHARVSKTTDDTMVHKTLPQRLCTARR